MGKSDKVIKLKFTKGLLHLPNTQFIDKKYYQPKKGGSHEKHKSFTHNQRFVC